MAPLCVCLNFHFNKLLLVPKRGGLPCSNSCFPDPVFFSCLPFKLHAHRKKCSPWRKVANSENRTPADPRNSPPQSPKPKSSLPWVLRPLAGAAPPPLQGTPPRSPAWRPRRCRFGRGPRRSHSSESSPPAATPTTRRPGLEKRKKKRRRGLCIQEKDPQKPMDFRGCWGFPSERWGPSAGVAVHFWILLDSPSERRGRA